MTKKYPALRPAVIAASCLVYASSAFAQEDTWKPVGSGSEEYPYEISSLFDLLNYASRIASYEDYSKDKFFILTADITVQDEQIIDKDGNLVADTTKLQKWNPIGTKWYGKSFSGTFDGRGHTISGIYVDAKNNKEGYAGLFGHLSGTVKNLSISNSYFCGGANLGAFAGELNGENALIENCVSYATVSGESAPTMQIGGMFGYTYYGKVKNSKNYGKIILNPQADEYGGLYNCSAGGIGGAGGSITDCENHGHITALNWGGIGGIVGSPRNVSGCVNYGTVEDFHGNSVGGINGWSGSIWSCRNYGSVISHAAGARIGGIGGQITAGGRIIECENYSDLSCENADVKIGGICGYGDIDGYTETYISRCINRGNITTTDNSSLCSGVVPYLYHADVKYCRNYGDVVCASDAGGLVALALAHGNIIGSENHGNVTGKGYVGGIAGQGVESVHGCVNFGDVTQIEGSRTGGIVGYMSSSSSFVIDCANLGNIVTLGNSMIGGIAGNSSSYGTIRCCYNSGEVVSYGDSWMGGIAGYMANGIYDCYNKGNIINYGSGSCLAGIAGWSNSSIENAFTTGYLYCLGENETVGHMVSGTYTSINGFGKKKHLYYSNEIVGSPAKYSNSASSWTFNKISQDEIAGLVDIFNSEREFGDTGGWLPGFYHPVLKRYYATENSDYNDPEFNYAVTTWSGDSTRIDLGMPFDNTFFKAKAGGGNAGLCYNAAADNDTIKRMWIVDHKDFIVPERFEVENAIMRIENIRGLAAKVLPWKIEAKDLPEGAGLYEPLPYKPGSTLSFGKLESAESGRPFMMALPDSVPYAVFSRKTFTLEQPTVASGDFTGTFIKCTPLPTSFVLNAADSTFVKATDQTSIEAFDAYLNIADASSDVLFIDLSGISGLDVNIPLTETLLTVKKAGSLSLEITGDARSGNVCVYNLEGLLVADRRLDSHPIIINLPSHGIYLVKTQSKTIKVAL